MNDNPLIIAIQQWEARLAGAEQKITHLQDENRQLREQIKIIGDTFEALNDLAQSLIEPKEAPNE